MDARFDNYRHIFDLAGEGDFFRANRRAVRSGLAGKTGGIDSTLGQINGDDSDRGVFLRSAMNEIRSGMACSDDLAKRARRLGGLANN